MSLKTFPPITPDQDPAGKLAEMVVNTQYEDLPSYVIELAKKSILDTIAVTIGGSQWECVPDVIDLVKHWGGAPESTVLIYGLKLPAPLAAYANGVMARAIDMGDVHETGGHVSEWVFPALISTLGITKKKITGKEFITAFVVASELGVRHHAAGNNCPNASYGVPGESHGPLYCAAATSRLIDSTVEQTWNALGMAYSVHSMQDQQKYAEGTQMARLQHAFAGDTGIKASLLSQRGVTAPKGIYLGTPSGHLRHIHWEGVDPDILTKGLGKEWQHTDGLSKKPYPSCKFTHSYISAMRAVMKNNNLDYRQIADIHCIGSEGSRMTIEPREAKWNPSCTAEAAFSTPYTIAHAAITGNVFLDAFSKEALSNPETRELMKKVRVDSDPGIQTQFDGFTVEVTLQNGKKYSETNQYVLGHTKNPMSWDDIQEKFWNCVPFAAVQLSKEKLQAAIDLCINLEEMKDMNDLVQTLTP